MDVHHIASSSVHGTVLSLMLAATDELLKEIPPRTVASHTLQQLAAVHTDVHMTKHNLSPVTGYFSHLEEFVFE